MRLENILNRLMTTQDEDRPCGVNTCEDRPCGVNIHADKPCGVNAHEEENSVYDHHCQVCGECFPSEWCLTQHVSTEHENINNCVDDDSLHAALGTVHRTSDCMHKGVNRVMPLTTSLMQQNDDSVSGVPVINPVIKREQEASHGDRIGDSVKAPGSLMVPEMHRCAGCRRTFATRDTLQQHRCGRGTVKPFGCGRCGRCFTQFSNLKEHATTHEAETGQELECFQCGQKFLYSIQLRRHANLHIQAEQARGREGNAAVTVSSLVATRRTKKGKLRKRFQMIQENQCRVCLKLFPQRSYLQLHMQAHQEKRFSCNQCEKKFTFKKSLEIHTRLHTGDRPYACDLCSRQFTRQDALQKHRNVHLGLKRCVCEQCGRQFADSFELRRHINVHNQERPYKCELCGKAYADNTRLKEHMFQHSGNMPYTCQQCGKSFSRKYRYNLHLSQHAGHTKFNCEVCGKGFMRRSDFNMHKLTHTSHRPFRCQDCGAGFIRENYLKRHELVHSGVKPWACPTCFKDFKRKNALTRHMLTHAHKVDDNSPNLSYNLKTTSVDQPTTRAKLWENSEAMDADVSVTSDFAQSLAGSVESGVGETVESLVGGAVGGDGEEERDIMRDIQAVIGVSVASMFSEVV